MTTESTLLRQIELAAAEVRRINTERARAVQARDQLIRQAWSLRIVTRDIARAAVDELTAEQVEAVRTAARDLDERYPDPDEQPEREAALSATVQYLLGETGTEDAKRRLIAARTEERAAYVAALQVAVMAHRHGGVAKATAAREVGIDRMRVLKALGER